MIMLNIGTDELSSWALIDSVVVNSLEFFWLVCSTELLVVTFFGTCYN